VRDQQRKPRLFVEIKGRLRRGGAGNDEEVRVSGSFAINLADRHMLLELGWFREGFLGELDYRKVKSHIVLLFIAWIIHWIFLS